MTEQWALVPVHTWAGLIRTLQTLWVNMGNARHSSMSDRYRHFMPHRAVNLSHVPTPKQCRSIATLALLDTCVHSCLQSYQWRYSHMSSLLCSAPRSRHVAEQPAEHPR